MQDVNDAEAEAEAEEKQRMIEYYNRRLQKLYEKYDEQSRQMEKHLKDAEDEDCGIKHSRLHELLARENQKEMAVLVEVIQSVKREIADMTESEPNWMTIPASSARKN